MSVKTASRAARRSLAALLLAAVLLSAAAPSAAGAAGTYYKVTDPLECAMYINARMSGGLAEANVQTPAGIDASSFFSNMADFLRILYSDYVAVRYSRYGNVNNWSIKVTMQGAESDRPTAEAKARAVVAEHISDGMTPTEKLAVLHDYVINNCEYDYEAVTNRSGVTRNAFTAYGMLVRGKGVCDAYSSAFALLCKYAGVPCLYFFSTEMDHSWNVVLLGSEMFFVDATYDDTGNVSNPREYFLLTPAQLREKGHTWDESLLRRVTDAVWTDKYKAASSLNALGVFKGTDAGYELERAPTRAEGAIMLLRLLGLESTAAQQGAALNSPFTDVSEFYKPYIAYMREAGLTQGTSGTTFSPGQELGLAQYMTFVLRALGYDDSAGDFEWNNALSAAVSLGVLSQEEANFAAEGGFDRGAMAYISARALFAQSKDGIRLGDSLAGRGAIDAAIFAEIEKYY